MPLQKIHLTNALQRDATVALQSMTVTSAVHLGLPGNRTVTFRRYLQATDGCMHERMTALHGADYGQKLVDGDPEVDLELVGRQIGQTDQVFLSSTGEVQHAPPEIVEVILGPDGAERERRQPQDVVANVNEEIPVRWTGNKMSRNDVIHRFVFRRTMQLKHVDGLTYDYLYGMAKELHEEQVMVLLRGGPDSKAPLVLQQNGSPYQGFLEGRIDGPKYQLLLHLSNMELKAPG